MDTAPVGFVRSLRNKETLAAWVGSAMEVSIMTAELSG
ncbi:hypothetical protein AHiyo8_30770 [Arthrobacter sp. Hiyo8]|nr:hypothetical protein AHiyo8_30770 [Arthrobacter sp. Hiyo8]